MTGFGRAEGESIAGKISAEIRTLNHRYLETTIRLPQRFAHLEAEVGKILAASLARGKVELAVRENGHQAGEVAWNGERAQATVKLLKREAKRLHLKDDLALSDLIHLPALFESPRAGVATTAEWNAVRRVIRQAVSRCVTMRHREGVALQKDVAKRLKKIAEHVNFISRQRAISERAQKKIWAKHLAAANEGIASERIDGDIAEELARARSHLQQMKGLLTSKEAVGRRLDFLIQELHREINTIGSKGQSVSISRTVVDFKSELEKIREQIQNIE